MQTGELIIIVLLALVVLGPKRLPELARKAGHWAAELRKAAREITAGLEAEVSEFKDLSDEIRSPLSEIGRTVSDATKEVSDVANKGLEWKGPKPLSGPTPEDAMRDLERIEGRAEGDAATSTESAVSEGEANGTETEPAETGPAETKSAETEPAEAGPAETEPAEAEPAEAGEEPIE